MRYLVISDVHGYKKYLDKIIEKESDIKNVIFLGDGLKEMLYFKEQHPDYNVVAVTGNCDSSDEIESKQIVEVKDHKMLVCHGDGYYVKMGLLPLRKACMEMNVDIALFGHTHRQYYEYYDGIYTFNPGSVAPSANPYSCYGIVDFTYEKPLFYHREL